MLEECQRAGITVSAAARERAEKAKALLEQADGLATTAQPSGALTVVPVALGRRNDGHERAGAMMPERPPPRLPVRLQCRGSRQRSPQFAERFAALFNFATVASFYERRLRACMAISGAAGVLEWLDRTKIVTKGHPLIFLVPKATPDWQRNLSFAETKKSCLQHVRDSILKFRNRIHTWDVINERTFSRTMNPATRCGASPRSRRWNSRPPR